MSDNSPGNGAGYDVLSAEQARLLELLIARQSRQTTKSRTEGVSAGAIQPLPRKGADSLQFPVSWAQQRLWFFDQLQGGSATYNISVALRLRGSLNEQALRLALHGLVQRHEILRTTFVSVDGDPKQRIAPDGRCDLQVVDLSDFPEAQRDAQMRVQKDEEARAPFDLSVGPLIRGRLLRVRPAEHVLLITMHHIVSDGWSIGVLVTELAELYSAACEDRSHRLEPLPIQYADYALWQRQGLKAGTLERQLSYWRARLDGAPTQLELPTDRPRPPV